MQPRTFIKRRLDCSENFEKKVAENKKQDLRQS